MNDQDFDTQELARYLHVSPQQLDRLISRQQLPARKVGGDWRFSRAEVHHWLEERLGVFDDETLARMESTWECVDRADEPLPLQDLMRPELIMVPLLARTRDSVIRDMVSLAAEAQLLWDPQRMAEAIRAREDLMSTAMENGVAILHPRRPLESIVAEPYVAMGITSQGIPFGGSRRLTDVFFCVASLSDRGHLMTLARLSRVLQRETFLPDLRAVQDALSAYHVVCAHEAVLETMDEESP